jgi:hypothetical protein
MSRADVSVEVAHLYAPGLTREQALEEVRREERALRPLLDLMGAEGLTVSQCILIDDTSSATDPEELRHLVLEACAEVGLRVDYVVHESACASSIMTMLAHYFPGEPLDVGAMLGTGGRVPVVDVLKDGERWVMNGEPARFRPPAEALLVPTANTPPERSDGVHTRPTGGRGTRSHSIHLDVELWSVDARAGSVVWSCAALASWWQLLRLGAPASPDTAIAEHAEAPPFGASTTLTVLPASFLVVEHAVRTILSRVDVPTEWLAPMRGHGQVDLFERISYLFPSLLPAAT